MSDTTPSTPPTPGLWCPSCANETTPEPPAGEPLHCPTCGFVTPNHVALSGAALLTLVRRLPHPAAVVKHAQKLADKPAP